MTAGRHIQSLVVSCVMPWSGYMGNLYCCHADASMVIIFPETMLPVSQVISISCHLRVRNSERQSQTLSAKYFQKEPNREKKGQLVSKLCSVTFHTQNMQIGLYQGDVFESLLWFEVVWLMTVKCNAIVYTPFHTRSRSRHCTFQHILTAHYYTFFMIYVVESTATA